MSDLISRKYLYEKLSKLEEQARNIVVKTPRDSQEFLSYCAMMNERSLLKHEVRDAPAVDAVEVVRCKNCTRWGTGVAGETEHVKCCEFGRYMVGENGYCVYGELRSRCGVMTE